MREICYRSTARFCEKLREATILWGSEQHAVVDSGTNKVVIVYGVWQKQLSSSPHPHGITPTLSTLMVPVNFKQP